MKLIKEHITHFTEDSDPIRDMGIGMDKIIKDWIEAETKYSYHYINNKKQWIWICAKYGKTEFVKYLLDKGHDVHVGNDAALILASSNGHVEVIKLLLDAGADVHAEGEYPLRTAAYHGYAEAVKLLLDAGADVHVDDDHTLKVAKYYRHDDVIKVIQDHIDKEVKEKTPNIKRKHVKESVTHFVEDSDPVHDMGIGMDVAIMHWLENETEYEDNKHRKKDLLWISAEYGKVDFVKYLLSKGYDIHINEDLPLRVASARGHTEVVKILLDAGANIHADNDGALRLAGYYKHINTVKLLKKYIAKEKQKLKESVTYFKQNSDPIEDMDIGIDTAIKKWIINNTDYKYELVISGEHLLWICAEAGKTEFVKHLLRKGYTIHKNDDFALRQAAENGHTEIVKMLIDAGADVHAYDEYSLRWAVSKGYTEIVKLLIDAGADVHIHGDVVLCRASELGRPKIVKLLLDAGADVHADNDYPLKAARRNGYPEVVKIIQNHIDKENKVVKESITHFREDSDPIEDMDIGIGTAIKKWITDNTDYNYEPAAAGNHLLWICAEAGKTEFVKYLLRKGYNIHRHDDFALRQAVENGHAEIVKMLIDAGANVHAESGAPICIASCYGHAEIVKLLLDAGADVHARTDYALSCAAESGYTEIAKLLLDAGADVNVDNDSPLRLAKEGGYNEIVKIIQNHIDKENKVVKESITHFREDSDPVQDMNIGIEGLYNEWLNDIFEWAPHIKDALRALEMGKEPPYLNRRIKEIELIIKYGDNNAEMFLKYFLKKYDIPVTFNNNYFLRVAADYDEFKLAKKLIDWGANIDNALGYAKIFQRSTKAADNLELIKRNLDEENS